MSGEAPDPREQEDCPGAEVCLGGCDQHHRCGWDYDPSCDGCRVAYGDAGMKP